MNRIELMTDSIARQSETDVALERSNRPSNQNLIEAAQSFESVLINKLVETMQDTVGQWGGEKESAFNQINGIFSFYLSDAISKQGGLGLWKDLSASLEQLSNGGIETNKLDQAL